MSADVTIRNALLSLASGGVYFDSVPMDTPTPFILINRIGGTPVSMLENKLPSKRNGRFQINCFHNSRGLVDALGVQAEKIMVETLGATRLSELAATLDDGLKLKGTQQDFSYWSQL